MAKTRFVPGPFAGLETFYDHTPTAISHGPFRESLNMPVSSGHYGYPDFPSDRDVGGTFLLAGTRISHGTVDVGRVYRYGDPRWYYEGSICAVPGSVDVPPLLDGSDYGGEAYRRMKPTKPEFNALNSVYELKDLPGMLRQQLHKNNLKNIGSYALAYKFGWESLLRDIRNLVETQQSLAKRLKQLLRDNGKPVRRRVVLAEYEDTQEPIRYTGNQMVSPSFVDQYFASAPFDTKCVDTRSSGGRVWASAQFRYWLPGGPKDIAWTRRMMARLYGFQPSPAVIYNMIPWTWLVDWFGDLGGLLENMDAGVADRLSADHFYVMREDYNSLVRTIETTLFTNGQVYPNHTYKTFTSTSVTTGFTKTRVAGDPFGFRTELPLDPMQLAIAGALGLSRIR